MSIERFSVVCLVLMLSAGVYAATLEPPPKARVQMVAPSTTALGMQLSIRRFESELSVEAVLAFYRQEWEDYREAEMPPWRMIGRLDEGEYLNVQVQSTDDGGSWGYLSISDLPARLADANSGPLMGGSSFPMMNGSTVLNRHQDRDPGRDASTLLIQNRFSASSNRRYYLGHFQGRGWNTLMDQTVNSAKGQYALLFQKGGESVAITISREDGATLVLANVVKRGLFR